MIFISGIMLFLLPRIKQVKHGNEDESSYSRASRQLHATTLNIQSAVAMQSAVACQLGVPPRCIQATDHMMGATFALKSARVWQKKAQIRNPETVVTKL